MDRYSVWNMGFPLLSAMPLLSSWSPFEKVVVEPELPSFALLDPGIDGFVGDGFAFEGFGWIDLQPAGDHVGTPSFPEFLGHICSKDEVTIKLSRPLASRFSLLIDKRLCVYGGI